MIPRAEMLAELARLKYSIAVAGTHGKTTTTSMIATILDRAGFDPTIVVGGLLNTIGSNARLGKGDYIVLEADESDRSFLLLSPTIAVVTNIEADHLDHYKDLEDIQAAFLSFINKVPFYGAAILCLDDPAVQSLIPHIKRRFVTYGTAAQADVSIVDCVSRGSRFHIHTAFQRRQHRRRFGFRFPAIHNVLNATAAFAAARDMGVDPAVIAAALEGLSGRGAPIPDQARDGITVIDDYAHHPTEIRATLSAAKVRQFPADLCGLSAASLYAHLSSVRRFCARVQSGRRGVDSGYLSGRREADRRHHDSGADRKDSEFRAPECPVCARLRND